MAYIGPFRDGWRAQLQRGGQRVSKTFRTKREAQQWAMAMEAKKTPLRSNTLGQAIKKYLETVSIHKSYVWEERRLRAFLEQMGDLPLSEITTEMVGNWRDDRLKTVSGSTVVRDAALYRNLWTVAVKEWKWVSENPFSNIRLPKENAPRQAIWRWQEIRRVLRAGQRTGGKTLEVTQAFHISLRTGMRLQEALAAPGAFKKGSKVIAIPRTKTAPKGELVPLTRQGYRLMEKITGQTNPVRGVSDGVAGFTVSPNEASVLFSKLCRQQLVKGLTFHDARATALTHMSRKMDVLTLGRISRHKDLTLLMSTYYRESAESVAARI